MATTQITAVGQYQACAYRLWQLDTDCSILKSNGTTGTSNAIVGTGVIRANMAVELKEGQEVEATTACGSLAWTARDVDRIKRWTMEFEIATWDYEALAMTVGGTLITGTGATNTSWNAKTIGWAAPGPTSNVQKKVALEIWSRAAYSTGVCASVSGEPPTYIRHIFPHCNLQLADRAFEEATPAYMKFTGRCEANPKLLVDLKNLTAVADTPWLGSQTISTDLANSTYIQMFAGDDELPTTDNAGFDGGYTVYTF